MSPYTMAVVAVLPYLDHRQTVTHSAMNAIGVMTALLTEVKVFMTHDVVIQLTEFCLKYTQTSMRKLSACTGCHDTSNTNEDHVTKDRQLTGCWSRSKQLVGTFMHSILHVCLPNAKGCMSSRLQSRCSGDQTRTYSNVLTVLCALHFLVCRTYIYNLVPYAIP